MDPVVARVREVLLNYAKWSLGSIVDIPLARLVDHVLGGSAYQAQVPGRVRKMLLDALIRCGIRYGVASRLREDGAWRLRFMNTTKEWRIILGEYVPCIEEELRKNT